jgi:hypothetical protein
VFALEKVLFSGSAAVHPESVGVTTNQLTLIATLLEVIKTFINHELDIFL